MRCVFNFFESESFHTILSVRVEMVWLAVGNIVVVGLVF